MYDMIIIGGGPAGLTAAVYGKRNGKTVLVIEKSVFGGQITNSPRVENIPGFLSVSGGEIADQLLDQAIAQGAEAVLEEVIAVEVVSQGFSVRTAEGGAYEGKSLILATGTTHRVLGLHGEEDLIGRGIHFCAVCDGDFYQGKDVVMIGGGNSAFVEANLLAGTVGKLILLQDLPEFTADAASQETLFKHANVEAHLSTEILAYETDEEGELTGVRYREDGEETVVPCAGVFLAVGLVPENGLFSDLADLDASGYFASDESCKTRIPGLFVAGDCRAKALRQVATACSDGAVAAMAAVAYTAK